MNIPIVMLHQISDDAKCDSLKPYSISTKSFIKLLDYLAKYNYCTTTFSEIFEGNLNNRNNEKNIIITIDDCYRDLFEFAIPELEKRNMKATFFMPTAHMGAYNSWDADKGRARLEIMNENELHDLSKLNMEIGSHGHQHFPYKYFTDTEISFQLKISKDIIENITGTKITSFAYPFGDVPLNYRDLLLSSEYSTACAIYHPKGDRYSLRRFIYHDNDTELTLKRKLSISYKISRSIYDKIKSYK
jgi:peptidoglycan/xylan/chitin deacetylase (PgdA/CDA1 family)